MTTYKTADGSLTIRDDAVILTFEGWTTQAQKKNASPRRIPFAAIKNIELVKPKGLSAGHLRFVLAGFENVPAQKPILDINTALLNAGKTYEAAASIEGELRQRIAGSNAVPHPELLPQSAPVSSAAAVVAPETRERTGNRKADKRSELAHQASAGGARPDIAAAVERMGWTFGGKREVKKLHEHLHDSERVEYIAQGLYDEHQGIVVLTDQRLLFVFHGFVNQVVEDYPLDRITAITNKVGLGAGSLTVHTGGAKSVISQINNGDLKALLAQVREKIAADHARPAAQAAPEAPDAMDQLRKLGELRDAGILTAAEFDIKKREILARI